VRAAAAQVRAKADAVRQRDEAIRAAWRNGHTLRDIATAAGLSYQRVAQIVRRPVSRSKGST
jgi:lambda repressor-like predicted transcriptional regulator